ncbi:phage/plasmid primase, P4 family [Streptomyces sp. CBG31]|uniref:DNA primase family protein n=2 Tax=unclassified Streptomyces TaxID=2593676 RepID=UPI001EFC6B10|nr:phage/plasmid primase, P4 family [Streptomyces sp. CBG31]
MTTEAEVIAFRAFQRDKDRQEKARQALEAATPEEREEFARYQAEQEAVAAEKEATEAAKKAANRPASGGVETTDAILAEQVSEHVLAGRYCWSAGLGWLRWTGTYWEHSNQQTVTETVRQCMVDKVTDKLRSPDVNFQKRQELMGLLSKSRIVALVELSKGILQVTDDMFDAHPDLLNTPSCVVHLPTGEVRPHDPYLYLTKITPVPYQKGATHEDFTKTLEALPEDLHRWLQIRLGQAITGHMTPDDVMLILQGGGENGKSTLFESICRALGKGYSILMSDRVLLADPGAHPTEMMDLRGARFAMAEELPEDRRLNVKRLKDVIGTPTMRARRMKQDPVEWDSTHSVMISTNYLPVIEETDHGTWRRLALVKFPYKFLKPGVAPDGPNQRAGDPGLRVRMKEGTAQNRAVLAWLIEGARLWYEHERVMPAHPERIVADTQAWRAKCDLILAYWLDRIEPDQNAHVLATDLFADFNLWLQAHGHRPWSDKTFGARFEGHDYSGRHGVERKKIRARAGLSRSPELATQWNAQQAPAGASYRAWLGVKFTPNGVREDE